MAYGRCDMKNAKSTIVSPAMPATALAKPHKVRAKAKKPTMKVKK